MKVLEDEENCPGLYSDEQLKTDTSPNRAGTCEEDESPTVETASGGPQRLFDTSVVDSRSSGSSVSPCVRHWVSWST